APKATKGSLPKSSEGSNSNRPPACPWSNIIDYLSGLLYTLKENFVFPILVKKIFTHVFSYIIVQHFNSLLLHQECCTFSNVCKGEYVKVGLSCQ
ncbi:hypothetical protein UlMin_042642, partial [Ulmus minor]